MKKSRRTVHRCNTAASRTRAHPLSNSSPIFEVIDTTRLTIDGVEYEFAKLVAHLPQPDGLWTQAHITVRLGDDAELTEAIDQILRLHASGQLALMAKEVHHA